MDRLSFRDFISISAARIRLDLLRYSRRIESLFFVILFPIISFLIFSKIETPLFEKNYHEHDPSIVAHILTAGFCASVFMNVAFQSLSIDILMERKYMELKRLSVMPLMKLSYFIGKIASIMVISSIQLIILLSISIFFFHLKIDLTLHKVVAAVIFYILGLLIFSSLGIVCGSTIKNSDSGVAFVVLPTFVLNFFSGVFIPISLLPGWIRDMASFFPLKWLAQGVRYVILDKNAAALEPGQAWHLKTVFLVLVIWAVISFVFSILAFNMRKIDNAK